MKLLLFLVLCVAFCEVSAQKYTISGYIRDAATGESLIGSSVYDYLSKSGTVANNHGFYSITLGMGSVKIGYSYVGYYPDSAIFSLKRDTVININLKGQVLDEVVVKATRADAIHESTKMSSMTISREMIKAVPAFMGEVDVLKVLQLIPGVQSGNEGSSGLYVRGGGPDQNLMLLDGVPVYNASHLFGFFSIFNASAINHVELIKGGFPARYGGRLSSVVDISMKEGNMKKLTGDLSVGLIATKGSIEGPIVKDRTSFIFSARRTYIDLLTLPFQRPDAKAGYYFYDLNFKINHIIDAKNRIFWSNYGGNDKFYFRNEFESTHDNVTAKTKTKTSGGIQWNNIISSFRWNHVFTPKLFSNLNFTYSRYRFEISQEYNRTAPNFPDLNAGIRYFSGIRDWAARLDLDFLPNPNHYIRYGVHTIFHRFTPGVLSIKSSVTELGANFTGGRAADAVETSAYAEDDWKIGDRLKVNVGVHGAMFFAKNAKYFSWQPRTSMRYLLNETMSAKASYAEMTQFIHLLSNSAAGLPTDLWVPATARIAPQQASQVAVGLAKTYRSQYEISLEGYYKKMRNLIDYTDGGVNFFDVTKDWQDNVVSGGHGKSYGMEVLVQKKEGRVKGWLGYTLSKTTRQFEQLNYGNEYPYKYDRRHDVSFTSTYEISRNIEAGITFVYGTGNAMTLPNSSYETSSYIPERNAQRPSTFAALSSYSHSSSVEYSARNSYRMEAYHRMDLSISFSKDKKHGRRKWTLAGYNVYNRKNPFFVASERDALNRIKFIQYSLFPFLPSFSYSFQFK
ncbi:MAG: TonB-dependent receptor [Candidatus Nephrothrix sp. EaCA]|nr:MAG: TonB-dependent receptor [Candidatus Nephrothrix sp. EaCA]